jgi:hypothetical protein
VLGFQRDEDARREIANLDLWRLEQRYDPAWGLPWAMLPNKAGIAHQGRGHVPSSPCPNAITRSEDQPHGHLLRPSQP